MTDPAEEAFQRMLSDKKSGHRFTGNDARDAAREALKPIRAKHRPVNWTNQRKCCISC